MQVQRWGATSGPLWCEARSFSLFRFPPLALAQTCLCEFHTLYVSHLLCLAHGIRVNPVLLSARLLCPLLSVSSPVVSAL